MADLPPIPHKAPMLEKSGLLTAIWSDWFRKLFVRSGENLGLEYIPAAALATNAVTTAKILAGAVSFAKLLSTDWTASKVTSGHQKLGSGLYVQWGVTASLNSATTTAITLPIAFPTACLQVISGIQGNSAGATAATGQWGTGNYSTTAFDLYNRTSAAYVFNYLAVGH